MSQNRSKSSPKTPTQSTPPPASSAPPSPPLLVSSLALDERRNQLEIEKLEHEVATAKAARTWWRKNIRDVKLSEWITTAAAIIAISAAFWTGLFNTIRERLSAQADRLAIEKIDLEQKKEKLGIEIATKEKQLTETMARLQPFEQEELALSELRSMMNEGMTVGLSSPPSFDSVRVSLKHSMLDWYPGNDVQPKTIRVPTLSKALAAANKLRSLDGISVRELVMNSDDVATATRRDGLQGLAFEYAQLDRLAITGMRTPKGLLYLSLRGNVLTVIGELSPNASVEFFDLSDNPIGDEALEAIPRLFPALNTLRLDGTKVTAGALEHLKKIPFLTSLYIRRTVISGKDIEKLFELPRLNSLFLGKGQADPETIKRGAELQGRKPVYVFERDGDAVPLWPN